MTEIRALWDASPTLRALFPDFEISDFEIRTSRPHWRLVAVSASDPAALAGLHGGSGGALIVVDEAAGLEDRFFLQLGPMLWGSDSRCFVVSTPQGRSGFFWDIYSGSGRELFDVALSVPLEELPHLTELAQREAKHLGADSAVYRQAYRAEFADAEESPLFPVELLHRARGIDPDGDESWMPGVGPLRHRVAGFDVAGLGGDDAAMVLLVGRSVRSFKVLPRLEPMALAASAIVQARLWRVQEVAVDAAGLGAGVADRMDTLTRGEQLHVHEYIGASKSFDDAAQNLKTAVALALRERLMEGQVGISDSVSESDFQRLARELSGMRLVQEPRSGKVRISDPPRSPDYADALLAALSVKVRPPTMFAFSPEWA
jgi:hypothetical protein